MPKLAQIVFVHWSPGATDIFLRTYPKFTAELFK